MVPKQSIDAMFPHFRNGAVRKGLSCHGVEIPSALGDVMHAIVVAVPDRRLLRMRQLLGASTKNIFIVPMSNVAPETLGLVQIRASLWGVRPPPPTNRACGPQITGMVLHHQWLSIL